LKNPLGNYHEEVMTSEEYNQEKKCACQREVALKSHMLDSLSCECEVVKHQMKMQLEQLEMQLKGAIPLLGIYPEDVPTGRRTHAPLCS
jgi:predicted nucleic acid-binding Zn ribbon protein